eukprot:COSAG02_NODE_40671_length_402_cov_3.145215_1_plen_68_part_01
MGKRQKVAAIGRPSDGVDDGEDCSSSDLSSDLSSDDQRWRQLITMGSDVGDSTIELESQYDVSSTSTY